MSSTSPLDRLESALSDSKGVYINDGIDKDTYLSSLTNDIREHMNDPFEISAEIAPPGFPDMEIGDTVSGLCVAHRGGYWLVYQPEKDIFYCFWGSDSEHLEAPGIFGSPLYCWSA
ncbi:hypothetical protein [Frateuria defendens]|uniref:hypothetical protein n=1 Tax=Frateuria defendens TaxID=2219559 RepID=UPI00129378CD|nr:hypothetical protein [Frateuria defendens]